jgi:hypothetical protein
VPSQSDKLGLAAINYNRGHRKDVGPTASSTGCRGRGDLIPRTNRNRHVKKAWQTTKMAEGSEGRGQSDPRIAETATATPEAATDKGLIPPTGSYAHCLLACAQPDATRSDLQTSYVPMRLGLAGARAFLGPNLPAVGIFLLLCHFEFWVRKACPLADAQDAANVLPNDIFQNPAWGPRGDLSVKPVSRPRRRRGEGVAGPASLCRVHGRVCINTLKRCRRGF